LSIASILRTSLVLAALLCMMQAPVARADIVVQPSEVSSTFPGPVVDSFLPPGDFANDSVVGPKAAPGARWSFIGYALDQTYIEFIFLSGTSATSGFAPNCLNHFVPQWTLTVTRDGQFFYGATGNVWTSVEIIPTGGYRCGLRIQVFKRNDMEVLTPGRYEFRMAQPAHGADLVGNLTVPACAAPLAMYAARHEGYTDNFYTTLQSDWQTARNTHGYVDSGVPFKVSRRNELTAPFKRFFKGAPQIEHFYSHLAADEQVVLGHGYAFERIEGNVFPAPVTGTLGLHRLSKFNGATGDLQHVYTTSAGEATVYQGQGWITDGVKGFVCAASSGATKLMAGGSLAGGESQTTPANSGFANPLRVTVRDQNGNALSNAQVTFSVPTTGASAVLSATSATTGVDGVASITATANSTEGAYYVTAGAAGISNVVNFTLTNTASLGCTPGSYAYESAALTGPNTWGPDMTFVNGMAATFSFTVPAGASGRMQIQQHTAYTTYPLPDNTVMTISRCKGDFNVTGNCVATGGQYVEVPFATTGTPWACAVEPGVTYYMNIKQTACYYGSDGVCGLRGFRSN
jgi:hypothetical protein